VTIRAFRVGVVVERHVLVIQLLVYFPAAFAQAVEVPSLIEPAAAIPRKEVLEFSNSALQLWERIMPPCIEDIVIPRPALSTQPSIKEIARAGDGNWIQAFELAENGGAESNCGRGEACAPLSQRGKVAGGNNPDEHPADANERGGGGDDPGIFYVVLPILMAWGIGLFTPRPTDPLGRS
jgi:hypothetical protein